VENNVDAVVGKLDRASTKNRNLGDVLGSDHGVEHGGAHQTGGASQNEMHLVVVGRVFCSDRKDVLASRDGIAESSNERATKKQRFYFIFKGDMELK
jgi:hypothetical protein